MLHTGSCGFPIQCLLPSVATTVKWSRADFLAYVKIFLADAALAAQLGTACAAAQGGPAAVPVP